MSEEKTQILCSACKKVLGERTETAIWPAEKTSVSIEKGFIYFQCPDDKTYVQVDKNSFDFTLYKPGAKRIY